MKMENILLEMIEQAEKERNYDLIRYAKNIVDILSTTINTPSNWRCFYEELLKNMIAVLGFMRIWNFGTMKIK